MKLSELSAASGVTPRNIRQYIERGLVSPPNGRTRAAVYSEMHLSQLLAIRSQLLAGLRLNRLRGRTEDTLAAPPTKARSDQPMPRRLCVIEAGPGLMLVLSGPGLRLKQAQQDTLAREIARVYGARLAEYGLA